MNKLILDFGNTKTKLAIFHQKKIIHQNADSLISIKKLNQLIKKYSIKVAMLSSVIQHKKNIDAYLQKKLNLVVLDSKSKTSFKNLYKSSNTLGVDRIANVEGAIRLFSKKNLLIIDAGTCITYDYVDVNKKYLGGSIHPGVQMRYKALYHFTQKLPLEKNTFSKKSFIGNSTASSIQIGVSLACVEEMSGMINLYQKKYKNLKVVITGGDSKFFERQLKNKIFAVPNLQMIGLNEILDLNLNEK